MSGLMTRAHDGKCKTLSACHRLSGSLTPIHGVAKQRIEYKCALTTLYCRSRIASTPSLFAISGRLPFPFRRIHSRRSRRTDERFRFVPRVTRDPTADLSVVLDREKSGQEMAFNFTGTQQKCKACNKTVYLMDQLNADGIVFHKSCFKCNHCKGTLTVSLLFIFVLM